MSDQELATPVLPTQYEDRLVCFIDLLGFKTTTEDAKENPHVLTALYEALTELEGQRLADHLHGSIPILTNARNFTNAHDADLLSTVRKTWPLVTTQFSDSFVISCSTSNKASALLLIQAIDFLQNIFFKHLGMLMRGGVSKGPLIHRQGGPLFGPAMNEAYGLESKKAIYPRVLLSLNAANYISQSWGDEQSPLFTTFDGHHAIDLISCQAFKVKENSQDWSAFLGQLEKIEQDIKVNSPESLPKVFYLKDRLSSHLHKHI